MIVPTLGRPQRLRELLTSVIACDPPPAEIVIVDGQPSDTARDQLASPTDGGTPVVYVPSVPGLTRQRMVGLERASSDLVLFVDDDVELPADAFSKLMSAFADPKVVGATGRVIEPSDRMVGKTSWVRRLLPGGGSEGGFTRFGYPRRVLADAPADVMFMQGCFMSARRDTAIDTGFDTALTGYGLAEDEDFSYRLSRRGLIRYLPDIQVVHHNEGFGSRDQRSFNRTVVVTRAYLFRKNFPQTLVARLEFGLFIGLLMVHRVINREWRGVRGLVEGSVDAWRGRLP